jgi:hypothetical protein
VSEQSSTAPVDVAGIRGRIHELAGLLRTAGHLDADAQQALAGLLDELGDQLAPTAAPSPATAHLAATAAQLAHALHERHETGVIAGVKSRLEEATCRAENEAPLALGIVRRLIDTLANMGI